MIFLLKMKVQALFYIIGALTTVIIALQMYKEFLYFGEEVEVLPYKKHMTLFDYNNIPDVTDPLILWWTPFTGEPGTVKQCGHLKCYFTQNRQFRNHSLIQAIMFYGSNIDIFDLPIPRDGHILHWALLHEESPKNTPVLLHETILSLFNYTATFSRWSHFPLTLQYLHSLKELTDTTHFVRTEEKDALLSELAPVLYVQSDCSTPSERDNYVQELMKYIHVDSYGQCLQNKKLPSHLASPSEMDSEDFLKFVAQYKFTLAIENAVCEDYITEKLWRPLSVGSIPIYMGSPSVKDWLPNNESAILISDFKSPKDLAHYLSQINKNVSLYENFLQHKVGVRGIKVTNKYLVAALESREWGINNDFVKGNFIEHFECFVCKKVHESLGKTEVKSIADKHHYYCPRPISPLTGKENQGNWWLDVWHTGKCEGRVLRKYIDIGQSNFSFQDFNEQLRKWVHKNMC